MSDLAPTVIVFPGASLMRIQRLTNEATLVTCPACGGAKVFTFGPSEVITWVAFEHEDDACPILLRVQDALRQCVTPIGSVQ